MKLVIQRVSSAFVEVSGKVISRIDKGLVILLGIGADDNESRIEWLAKKVRDLRIFPDSNNKLNLSVQQVGGKVLLISQFTLYANCQRGRRPDFTAAAPPDLAEKLYLEFGNALEKNNITVQYGKFAAMMNVHLVNDGPLTIILEK
jgi:D-tyrosyl-tRNA(Tyr) deacylase